MPQINLLKRKPIINRTTTPAEAGADRVKAERKPPARRPSLLNDFIYLLLKIISIVVIFTLVFTFLYGFIPYQEPGMVPAIKDGDLVIYYRYTSVGYFPEDVIALEYQGRKQARRVVATAGDSVDITDDGLIVNGALLQEYEIYTKAVRYQAGVDLPLTVPEGQVFVLGDSRADATDSRIYGPVKIEDTLGKVMAVIRRRNI